MILDEEDNPAYRRRKRMPSNLKAIWDAIDRKQSEIQEMVFGELGEKLDGIALEKAKAMGMEYAHVPTNLVSAGNSKLPPDVLIVNMSSSLMCPSFYLGLCTITNGSCYAQNGENRHSNSVIPKLWPTDIMTTQMLQNYQKGNKAPIRAYFSLIEHYIQLGNAYATNAFKREIKSLEAVYGRTITKEEKNVLKMVYSKYRIREIRVNESGDFHCQLAVDLWSKFADKVFKKYGINVHAYTARHLDVSNISDHMAVNASNANVKQGNTPSRTFIAVSDEKYNSLKGGNKTNGYGQPILGRLSDGKFFYKCPCSKDDPQCDICRVCFNKNTRGVPYTIYVKYHGVKSANGLKNLFKKSEVENVIKKMEEYGWVESNEMKKYNSKSNQERLNTLSKNIDAKKSEPTTKKTKSKEKGTKKKNGKNKAK